MKPKIIRSEADYDAALSRVEELIDLGANPGTPEFDELELLGMLVESYEDSTFPMDLPDPLAAIEFRMEQEGLTRKDMAKYLGSASKVSEVLGGKRSLSLTMIRKLANELGIPADVLLQEKGAELPDDGFMKEARHFPVAEMVKRGWFAGFSGSSREARGQLEDLMRAFVAPLGGQTVQLALNRQTIRGTKSSATHAMTAWRIRVAILGLQQKTPEYIPETVDFDFLSGLAKLSALNHAPLLAREYLARAGIPLVIEKHLPKTYLDGAAILLPDGRPMVALTLRYDRLDNFWFTLFHELAHIALHLVPGEAEAFFDDTSSASTKKVEREADELASEALIPESEWRTAKLTIRSDSAQVTAFARSQQLHPSIPAGRIRFKAKNYQRYSQLLGNGMCRKLFAPDS